MTASDHAQQRAQRFPLPGRGRPQMESGPSPRHIGVAGLRRFRISHNVQFGLSQAPEGDRTIDGAPGACAPRVGAADDLRHRQGRTGERDNRQGGASRSWRAGLRPGVIAESNIAIWRERGTHRPCVASLRSRPSSRARTSCTRRRWIVVGSSSLRCSSPGATGFPWARPRPGSSTGSKANPPQAHE